MENYKSTKSYKSFIDSPYRSIKHKSYFACYDILLEEYIGNDVELVEYIDVIEKLISNYNPYIKCEDDSSSDSSSDSNELYACLYKDYM